MDVADAHDDVLILGGGLAGLTLALHLRARFPEFSIRVLERRVEPPRAAAHKVGESTVEIGADYFANVLGLRAHLDARQIRKFGFRFFFSEGREDLDGVTELGVSRVLDTPTWQLDRGVFESFLIDEARAQEIAFDNGCTVRAVAPGHNGALHAVRCERDGGTQTLHARWLVDASGRAGLLKRHFDLAEDNDHDIGAAWFRIGARLEPDAWCDDAAWRARCAPPERWRSTNHLCGPGYWVWLIPLVSGAHSVGIVADAKAHPIETFNSYERALAWLRVHQPALARELDKLDGGPMDFAYLRRVSYGCKQVFSADRWALTGEAGLFLDPFYSPGSDFIAIANHYIVELIARDRVGEPLAAHAAIYQDLYFSFYRNMLGLFRGQYALFGDPQVMPMKVIWDYAYYWGVLCPLAIGRRLTDLNLLSELRPQLAAAQSLNETMQAFFRTWHAAHQPRSPRAWLDQHELRWFAQLNSGLHDELDDTQVRARLRANVELLHALAGSIGERAARGCPGLEVSALLAAAGTRARPPLFRQPVSAGQPENEFAES
ncbi:MAG: tryptophan 7-halogenase [Proteobacteria bacterium]|nr:tryptophan 7-halogenase [Pseudomonadota bacterium]